MGQKLVIEDEDENYEIDQVHFYNESYRDYALVRTCYLDKDTGKKVVDIPDVMFTESGKLQAYAYVIENGERYTLSLINIKIKPRVIPEDYVAPEQAELWSQLESKVSNMDFEEDDLDEMLGVVFG